MITLGLVIKSLMYLAIIYIVITATLWGFELKICEWEISFEGIVRKIEKFFEK
ncbi:hypothetical protein HUW86_09495 [Fusobacterium sp. SB021]|uniref:hypothetical protein n=1 Tax=Fusobacterium sp. SB021 TaxID=2744227 RepID=UPI003CF85B2E